jgi:hypothetical protein
MTPSPAVVPEACPMDSSWTVPSRPPHGCSARPRGLAAARRVLVGHGGTSGRVPHAVHQLTQAGTLVGRELITGVAQVVKVDRREPSRLKGRMPDATAEVATPQRTACGGWWTRTRHHRARRRSRCVRQGPGRSPREPRQSITSVRLGRPEREPAAAMLAELPGNPDGMRLEVDIRPAQRGQLTQRRLPKTASSTRARYRSPTASARA